MLGLRHAATLSGHDRLVFYLGTLRVGDTHGIWTLGAGGGLRVHTVAVVEVVVIDVVMVVVSVGMDSTGLQFGEDLREKCGLCVDSKHIRTECVDYMQTSVPEPVLVVFYQERFQRIRNLISHVGVRKIETSQNDSLEFLL